MLDSLLAMVQVEKEDLSARLHGTESVKDFLVAKVTTQRRVTQKDSMLFSEPPVGDGRGGARALSLFSLSLSLSLFSLSFSLFRFSFRAVPKLRDAELALKRSIDEQKKTTRQSQSDSEVINFLDTRVRELEAQGKSLRETCAHADATLRREQTAAHEAQQMMNDLLAHEVHEVEVAVSCRVGISSPLSHPLSARNDLLAHERRARAEAEGESKAQKKLLVKEVKMLRTQVSGSGMQCNAMQCNAMQCNAMQCHAMPCNAMQCNAMQCNAMPSKMLRTQVSVRGMEGHGIWNTPCSRMEWNVPSKMCSVGQGMKSAVHWNGIEWDTMQCHQDA